MHQQAIPQRKQSTSNKYETQKQYFNNTNVLTGISQTAIANSQRPKQPSTHKGKLSNSSFYIDQTKVGSSEKVKRTQSGGYQSGYDIIADQPLSPNSKVVNAPTSTVTPSNFLNQTAPIKFSSNTRQQPHYQDQTDVSNYHSAAIQQENNQKIVSSSNQYQTRTSSSGKQYQQHQPVLSQKQTLTTPKAQYSNIQSTPQGIQKQNSNNNLRNKYNRYTATQQVVTSPGQNQQVSSSQSQGRTPTNPSKSSSSINLLNKTQQQIPSQLLAQANAQYSKQHGYANQYARNDSNEKTLKVTHVQQQTPTSHPQNSGSSRNQSAKVQSNMYKTNNGSSKSIIPATSDTQQVLLQHTTTLNEYKQFMEKQKQMLKQLSSSKLAVMLNALNTSPRQIQQQILSKKPSSNGSKIQSPRLQAKVSSKGNKECETYKENIALIIQNTNIAHQKLQIQQPRNESAATPRGGHQTKQIEIPVEKPQNVNQQKVGNTTGGTTPRQAAPVPVPPPAKNADCDCNHPSEPQAQEQNQENNPNDDSMCFSKKSSLEEYIIGKQIGQGAYAVVRIGLHKPSNKKVAMKIYKKYKLLDPNRRKSVKREIKLMEKMKHQHIIRLYEVIDTTKYVILVMEYVGGGSLHGYLKARQNRRLDEDDAKRIFRQVLEGIKYCHSRCITHRDIKLENLLLDDQNNIKIIDFGFSTCIPNDKKIKIFCGTPSYMGPEIVQKTEYAGPPADIWALGVLLFTILSGCFPYRGATDKELYKKIMNAEYRLPSEVKSTLSIEAINLLKRIFSIDANKRPTAKEILQDPWLNDQSSNSQINQQQQQQVQQSKQQPQRSSSIQPQQPQPIQESYKRDTSANDPRQQPYQKVDTQQAAQFAYFGNAQAQQQQQQQQQPHPGQTNASTPQHSNGYQNILSHQKEQQQNYPYAPYQDTNATSQIPQSLIAQTLSNTGRTSFINNNPCSQNIMSGGNTINNNFNIVNSQRDHILIILKGDDSQRNEQTPNSNINNFMQNQNEHQFSEEFDESIIQSIVSKLGYTTDEVKKYVKEENSFVSVLYYKIAEEQGNKNRSQKSFSAKGLVQPSVVPSISSSMNQSNISFNNTQPIPFGHLDRSRDPSQNPNHNYYGSYSESNNLNQTMVSSNTYLNSSLLSGLNARGDKNQAINRNCSLGGGQGQAGYDMLSCNEEDNSIRHSMIGGQQQIMNSSLGHVQFNNTQGNLTALLSNASFNDQNYLSSANDNNYQIPNHGNMQLNSTQPLNLSGQQLYQNTTQPKIIPLGGAAAELQNMLINQGARRSSNIAIQEQKYQPQNVPSSKNLQWRREFL